MAVIDAHAHIYPNKIASRAVDAVGDFYLIDMFGEGTVEHLLSAQQHAPITHLSLIHISIGRTSSILKATSQCASASAKSITGRIGQEGRLRAPRNQSNPHCYVAVCHGTL